MSPTSPKRILTYLLQDLKGSVFRCIGGYHDALPRATLLPACPLTVHCPPPLPTFLPCVHRHHRLCSHQSGSVRVVVGPKLADLQSVEPQGFASLTLATDRVRGLASAAVTAGGHAVVWVRVV